MAHAIFPVTHILNALTIVNILAFAMAESIQHLALVCALVWPGVCTLTSDFILFEFAVIDRSVCPLEDTTAPEKTQTKLTFVLVSVLELTRSVAMIDLADLRKIQGLKRCLSNLPIHSFRSRLSRPSNS